MNKLDKFNKVCIVTCSDVYEKIRADFVYNYFKNCGVDVIVHTTDFLHIEKQKRTDKKENYIFHNTKTYKKNLSVDRIISHMKLAKEIFQELEDQTFDLMWVILPPNSCAKEAAKYKKKHPEVKLVFDIMDLWPETMPVAGIEWLAPIKYWGYLRDNNLSAADLVVTECNLFKERLRPEVQPKLRTMLLGRITEGLVSENCDRADSVNLCYLGSMNNIIDIGTITDMITQIGKKKPVCIHVIGDGEKKDEFLTALSNTGAQVDYHGRVYDSQEKKRIFDDCHFGLNIMKSTVVVGLTMKSIDYFEFGIPVINNIHGDTWEYIKTERLGVNLEGDYVDEIIRLANDKELRNRAHSFFTDNLSEESVSDRLTEILEEL